MAKAVEIQVDNETNADLFFRPINDRVRGSFDQTRLPDVSPKLKQYPNPVPGQVIGVDPDGSLYVRDPIYDDEFSACREFIEKRGFELSPQLQNFDGIDTNTALFWMKRAVDGGLAKIVEGTFPKIDPEKAKKNFVTRETKSSTSQLADAVREQTEVLKQVLSKLAERN